MNNRILFSDDGILSDFSVNLSRYKDGTHAISYVAGEDALFIGSRCPFNHFFLKLGAVVNLIPAEMSISYWDGTEWVSAVEVIDETNGLAKSGFVTFVPNKQKFWSMESTNDNGEKVDGLESVCIYDQYWIKISFDVTLTPAIVLAWVGQLFCEDSDIGAEYPDINRQTTRTAFGSGKLDWEEQRVVASELIIKNLVNRKIIWNQGQILERNDLKLACVSKTAEIAYGGLGDDYVDQKKDARLEFDSRINKIDFKIDKNSDGILSPKEMKPSQGWLSR